MRSGQRRVDAAALERQLCETCRVCRLAALRSRAVGAWLSRLVAVLFLVAGWGLVSAGEANGVMVVESAGEGATMYEAQQDAIRRALQQAVPQIVVADRTIENDDVKIDRVMSSMNGFIQGLRVLDQRRDRDGVSIRLRVAISTTEIENFVNLAGNGTSMLSGQTLLAESTRAQQSRDFRSRFLARFFVGYPYQAIDAKVASIQPSPGNPAVLRMTVSYRLDQKFIDAVSHAAEVAACPVQDIGDARCSPQQICATSGGTTVLGMHVPGAIRCTVLAAAAGADGRYAVLDALRMAGRLAFAARFVRDDGTRVVDHPSCFDWTSIRYLESSSHGGGWRVSDPIELQYGMAASRRVESYLLSAQELVHTYELPVSYLQGLVPFSQVAGVQLTAILGDQVALDRWHDADTVPILARFELTSLGNAMLIFNSRRGGNSAPEAFSAINDGPDLEISEKDRARIRNEQELIAPKRFSKEACLWR